MGPSTDSPSWYAASLVLCVVGIVSILSSLASLGSLLVAVSVLLATSRFVAVKVARRQGRQQEPSTVVSTNSEPVRWLLVSLASALVAMAVVGVALVLPFGRATMLLGVGVVVFLLVLSRNPEFWHRRTAASILGVWLASCVTAGINVRLQFDEKTFGQWVMDSLDWPFHLAVATVVLTLLILDYLKNAAAIHNAADHVASSAGETETERLISQAPQNERGRLALQALQEKSQFFSVDTDKLTREQRLSVAQKQIDSKERLAQIKSAEKKLLVENTKSLIFAGCLVLAFITSGAVSVFPITNAYGKSPFDADGWHIEVRRFVTSVLTNGLDDTNGRTLYSDVVTALEGGREGWWLVGWDLTTDNMAYEISARDGKWNYEHMSRNKAKRRRLESDALIRDPKALNRIAVQQLVVLREPIVRITDETRDNATVRMIHVRVNCERKQTNSLRDLQLAFRFHHKDGKTSEALRHLENVGSEVPSNELEFKSPFPSQLDLTLYEESQLYLLGFAMRPKPLYYRISNVLDWVASVEEESGPADALGGE